jgi:hypothetical protein
VVANDPTALPEHAPEWVDALCTAGPYRDASRYYRLFDGREFVLPLVAGPSCQGDVVDGRDPVRIPTLGYSMRHRLLLELLRSHATAVGVHIEAGRVTDANAVARGADLVIASDGSTAPLRRQQAGFGTRVRRLRNKYIWLVVRNRRWHVGNLALMGDAAHTTHFTIGSGTHLARMR